MANSVKFVGRLCLEAFDGLADLTYLVGLGLTALFRLQVQEHRNARASENMVAALDSLPPARGFEKPDHVGEPVAVIPGWIEQRGLDFPMVRHAANHASLNYSVNAFE